MYSLAFQCNHTMPSINTDTQKYVMVWVISLLYTEIHVQYRPEVRLRDSPVRVTRRLACKICRIFITSQLDSKRFESKMHCTITKLTRATRKTRVWFYMLPDPVYDCPCENLPTQSERVPVRAIKTKEKTQLCSKRTNPAFVFTSWCVRLRLLANALRSFRILSNAVVCSKGTQ